MGSPENVAPGSAILSRRHHCERAKYSTEKPDALLHLFPVFSTQYFRRSRRKNELCGYLHTLGSVLLRLLVHALDLYSHLVFSKEKSSSSFTEAKTRL